MSSGTLSLCLLFLLAPLISVYSTPMIRRGSSCSVSVPTRSALSLLYVGPVTRPDACLRTRIGLESAFRSGFAARFVQGTNPF